MTTSPRSTPKDSIIHFGRDLRGAYAAVLDGVAAPPQSPQVLVRLLGIDKVLASRILKSVRSRDPLATVHHAPGPEPLRRIARAARRRGVDEELVRAALRVSDEFEELVRLQGGDRASLAAIIGTFLPDIRREHELRNKQTAFRAMSQLKGVMADTCLSTVILHPAADSEAIDIVWVFGFLSLTRLRPGVPVKFATRRMADVSSPRRPTNLDGETIHGVSDARIDMFCEAPADVAVSGEGDVVHYTLGDHGYGPTSAADIVFAEVNLSEMPRYVPEGTSRKGNVFAEVNVPAKRLLFDVFVHADVYSGREPELLLYDTVLDGVANVNDASRNIDRLDMLESIQPLGFGLSRARHRAVPNHVELLSHVYEKLGWEPNEFRLYRCAIDYPIYGVQAALAFDPPTRPS
jgi:hypothetical protein